MVRKPGCRPGRSVLLYVRTRTRPGDIGRVPSLHSNGLGGTRKAAGRGAYRLTIVPPCGKQRLHVRVSYQTLQGSPLQRDKDRRHLCVRLPALRYHPRSAPLLPAERLQRHPPRIAGRHGGKRTCTTRRRRRSIRGLPSRFSAFDDRESIYLYEQEFALHGRTRRRSGLIPLVRLDRQRILTHEETRQRRRGRTGKSLSRSWAPSPASSWPCMKTIRER